MPLEQIVLCWPVSHNSHPPKVRVKSSAWTPLWSPFITPFLRLKEGLIKGSATPPTPGQMQTVFFMSAAPNRSFLRTDANYTALKLQRWNVALYRILGFFSWTLLWLCQYLNERWHLNVRQHYTNPMIYPWRDREQRVRVNHIQSCNLLQDVIYFLCAVDCYSKVLVLILRQRS